MVFWFGHGLGMARYRSGFTARSLASFDTWLQRFAGFAGHANYCVANAAVDSMATTWTAQGHPAVAVQWGAWASVGEDGPTYTRNIT